jgi:hypothetical protein
VRQVSVTFLSLISSLSLALVSEAAYSQVVPAPATPQIGSSNTVSADPPVPRPHSKPCTVQLLTNEEFADYNAKTFSYAPPANCPGPWAKVVLTADFTVTEGRQYDRTAQFFLGGANIYFGTTAEPRATLSPSWHVERDVTDLSAIFQSDQSGSAILGNFVGVYNGVTYDGIIYGDAALVFYPADYRDEAPRVPNVVVGLPGNSGAATVNTTATPYTQTLTLPDNIETAYLDVFAQSQSDDEFWYLCVPNDVANELESCGNTGFRETEIAIDGQPAGVAPVYPWIFTGGIDPYLWEPIPGVQTLDFKPYRVDLTPFAGVLSNGQSHTVTLGVFNADSYFSVTANLLLYLDPHAKQVNGAVVSNNLASAPTPVVTEKLSTDAQGDVSGSVGVTSKRDFSITGYVNTSHGRVETTVAQQMAFSNVQTFNINATTYIQSLDQATTVKAQTTHREGFLVTTENKEFSYPLTVVYNQVTNSDGSYSALTKVDQQLLEDLANNLVGFTTYASNTINHVTSQDTLDVSAANVVTGHTGSSAQDYSANDSKGYCYSESLASVNSVLTSYKYGADCRQR